jgi:hypothetical protein
MNNKRKMEKKKELNQHGYTKAMLGISVQLSSTSKNALSFLLCLCLFFNKISHKGRTGRTCLELRWGGEGGWRNDPNNVCTCE